MKLRCMMFLLFIMLAFTAAVCAFPAFAALWAQHISQPILRILHRISMPFPFVLLEWSVFILVLALLIDLLYRKPLRMLKKICVFILSISFSLSILWLPLYHADKTPTYSFSEAQLVASCEMLISRLNTAALDFSHPPEDLPAKTIAFPSWMRRFNISGFFSFPTGEALVSPELPGCALPFVSVHEAMHARGYASEGAANIAAWEECMLRRGPYANSARIYALRYSMAQLYRINPQAYCRLLDGMNEDTRACFRLAGGNASPSPHSDIVSTILSLLGIDEVTGNYEILAAYLASQMPE